MLLYVFCNLSLKFVLYAPIAKLYVGIPDRNFFLRLIFFASYFLRYFKGCLIFATSLNRFTSVVAYISHERIWKYAFPISLFIAFGIAISLSWYYFFGRIVLIPMDAHNVTYGLSSIPDFFSAHSAIKLALFGFIFGSLDFIVNTITCMMLYLNRHQNVVFNRIIIGLMTVTLIEFLTQMMLFTVQGALFILGVMQIFDGIYNDFYFAMCWITDLNTLLKPYMLLLMSEEVRECFLDTYWRSITKNSLFRSVSDRFHAI